MMPSVTKILILRRAATRFPYYTNDSPKHPAYKHSEASTRGIHQCNLDRCFPGISRETASVTMYGGCLISKLFDNDRVDLSFYVDLLDHGLAFRDALDICILPDTRLDGILLFGKANLDG